MADIDTKGLRALCEAATRAWEQIDAACSGLLASQCKSHRPYMGCPMDCGDVANALDPELLNAQPVLNEALRTALPALLDRVDELTRERELWRTGCVAWQEWARPLVTQPEGGIWGDAVAREMITANRDRLRAALSYLRRKIDGYDETFDAADEIAAGAVSPDGMHRIAAIKREGGIEP